MTGEQIVSIFRHLGAKNIFEDIDFPYALIKGEALSFLTYGETGKRISTDIDILVSRENIHKLEKILVKNGFVSNQNTRKERILMLSNSHQTPTWEKQVEHGCKVTIDVNFDIFWGEYEGKHVNINEFLNDTIDLNIYGLKIKSLSPLKALIHLILHNYKDINSIFLLSTRKKITTDIFKEIYFLLKNNKETITTDVLYNAGKNMDIIPYIFYMLYFTKSVINDKFLDDYIEKFKTQDGILLLDMFGLSEKERKKWDCSFETRLNSDNLFNLIEDKLTFIDKEKIRINCITFLGEKDGKIF